MDPTTTVIRWPLKAWMGVEVAFGLAAISAIFLRPDQTAQNFAWTIRSTAMAAALGAFYLASAIIFVIPLFEHKWQNVRTMIIPTAVFSTVMLVATFLHWELFRVGSAPFYVWFASYLLPPPIFLGLYMWHQRHAAAVGEGVERPVPEWTVKFFRINGGLLTLFAIVVFILPKVLIRIEPWPFNPLTARTFCGWLIAIGTMQLWMSREGDWDRMKLATTMLIVLPVAMAFQLNRYSAQVDWNAGFVWILLADLASAGLVSIYLWVTPRQFLPKFI